jgi:pyrroloquinoline quinone (PQQ) biosynthesis protein C
MFIMHPDLAITSQDDVVRIEDRETRLSFDNDSAKVCRCVLDYSHQDVSIRKISSATGYSVRTIEDLLGVLEGEGFVLRLDFHKDYIGAAEAIAKIRAAASFWNRHVMGQFFPVRLFAGEASRPQVLGWGIEFYHFVRAAREYMARGASRTAGDTGALAELWDHFSEEAFHDEIFLEGLVKCGISEEGLVKRPPTASTMGLLNHLWESSEEGELEYATVFALMQPRAERLREDDIKRHYGNLRAAYPFAAPMFDAFERHDCIDAELEHASLSLEPLLRFRGGLTRYEMRKLLDKVRHTAEHFNGFFEGILDYYKTELDVTYRQLPNASSIAFAEL